MSKIKSAVLFKTPGYLELYIFDSSSHCISEIKAFINYEGKLLLGKVSFKEQIKTSSMISKEFCRDYLGIKDLNHFKSTLNIYNSGSSSRIRFSPYSENHLINSFKEYFSLYKDSMLR